MSLATFPKPAAVMHIDGVAQPAHYGSVQDEVNAIRRSVGLTRLDHVSCIRLSGADAYTALDRLVPSDLFIRDGQLRQSLLLRPDGTVLADVHIGNDDESWLIFAEGAERELLLEHVREHSSAPGNSLGDLRIEDLNSSHALLSLNGPFAWELMAEVEGEEIIAFPYLSLYHPRPESIYLRTGKTGEFGYDLLVPQAEVDALSARLLEQAEPLEVTPVGMLALWCCALENWFFNVHREGRAELTPIELGLQWRVSYDKDFVGAEALRARRRQGARERLTALRCAVALKAGDLVIAEQQPIGRILHAEPSLTLGGWAAIGLLDAAYAHSGIEQYRARRAGEPDIAIETVSAPFVNNLSLYVNPQRHSIRDRETIDFPGPDRAGAAERGPDA